MHDQRRQRRSCSKGKYSHKYIPPVLRGQKNTFGFEAGEKAIFVFPIYCGAMPMMVSAFIEEFDVKGEMPEIIGIATCAGSASGCDRAFDKAFRKKGMEPAAFYSIKMVNNCIFYFKIPIREAALMQLKRSEVEIRDMIDSIKYRHRKPYRSPAVKGLTSRMGAALLPAISGTRKFRADESCFGCGLCEAICPSKAIKIEDGRPVWTKKKCEHCTACINRCPAKAIQYGRGTRKRYRYAHPEV